MSKKEMSALMAVLTCAMVLGGCSNTSSTNTTTVATTTTAPTTTVATTTTTVAKVSKEDYIAKCKAYTYKEIARNPEMYKGQYAKLEGEVIQVIEENGFYTLRVNITKNEYDFWEDTIMVGFQGSADMNRILEDDIVTMYGVLGGMYTYESTLGSSVTVPLLYAEYIDIK